MAAQRRKWMGAFAHLFGIHPNDWDDLSFEDTAQLIADAESIIEARKSGGA